MRDFTVKRLRDLGVILLILTTWTTTAFADQAGAPQQEGGSWSLTYAVDAIEDHPTDGLLAISASFYWWHPSSTIMAEEGLACVELAVTDPMGLPLEGELSFDASAAALLWKGAAPFEAETTYHVSLAFLNQQLNIDNAGPDWYQRTSRSSLISPRRPRSPLTQPSPV
jgi:hypothetical protein